MEYILVIAALYNLFGAFAMWFQQTAAIDSNNPLTSEYMQYRIFTGGTAFLFSIIYLYIFMVPESAMPLLLFGILLKLWSFSSSLICYKKFSFPKAEFLKVGVGNLTFAVLFTAYLVTRLV
jgi:hypothetical protein